MNAWRRWQDYATMVLGVVLFATPFAFGDTGHTTAAYGAYVLGVLVLLSGVLSAAFDEARRVELVPVVLGVVTFLAPWVLGFTAVTAIAWAAWIVGVLTVLGAGSLLVARGGRSSLA